MSTSRYDITNETRGYLAQYAEDLIDIAGQGNAPSGETVAYQIERIIEDQYYEAAARDADGRVVDE